MNYETFSRNVLQVIDYATALAKRYGCRYIGTEHILFGLINVSDGRAGAILREEGVDNDRFLYLFQKTIDKTTIITGNMFTARTKRMFENAIEISLKARAGYVGTEHFLLAILLDDESIAVAILKALNVNVEGVAKDLANALFGGFNDEEEPVEEELAEEELAEEETAEEEPVEEELVEEEPAEEEPAEEELVEE